MGPLYAMINALQIMVMTQAVNVKFPANAMFVFNLVRMITQCDILPEEIREVFYFWRY